MHRTLSIINAVSPDSLLAYPVLAHAGELHGRPAEPAATSDLENSSTDDDTLESETSATTAQTEVKTNPTEANTLIEVDASAPSSFAGLPAGLGESLFTVLVAFPWLLIALRMQLHTQTRS